MSDSVRPHRRHPTRLPRPWNSSGKNTGVSGQLRKQSLPNYGRGFKKNSICRRQHRCHCYKTHKEAKFTKVLFKAYIWTLKSTFFSEWSEFKNRQASLVAQKVKRQPTMSETWVLSLAGEDPLEKEIATHSSTLACNIHGWRSLVD